MSTDSTADLASILAKGGAQRVALLRHCVKSGTMEPMFVLLAQEYASRPTRAGAIALFDVFCAQNAPAVIRAPNVLPPRDLRLSTAVARLRLESEQLTSQDDETTWTVRLTSPRRGLFDDALAFLRNDSEGPLASLSRRYNPDLDPFENLPGGKLTMGQRHFVDEVWRKRIRPRLVDAGFWQISTID